MIVIGTDTHKRTHTAVAVVAGSGELSGELTAAALPKGFAEMLIWARGLDGERIWAIEDCRHVSGGFERFLVDRGERVVRIAPKLMGASRKGTRRAGKSDSIDAPAIARAALAESPENLPAATVDEQAHEIKLLLDHHDDLVAQRSADQRRLRWHLHDLWPELELPAGSRFATDAKLAGLAGIAPIPVSSGMRDRYRLDRRGNRRLNCAFHRLAVTQGRVRPDARDYLQRKQAEGREWTHCAA